MQLRLRILSRDYTACTKYGDRGRYDYGEQGEQAYRKFVGLRLNLIPYLYTLAHDAHMQGIPLMRGMYLEYPDSLESYIPCTGSALRGVNRTSYGTAPSVGGLIYNGGFEEVETVDGHPAARGWVPYLSPATYQQLSTEVVHSGKYSAALNFSSQQQFSTLQNCGPNTNPACLGVALKSEVDYEYTFWALCTVTPCVIRTEWLTQPKGAPQLLAVLVDSSATKFHKITEPGSWVQLSHRVVSGADQSAVVVDTGLCGSGCAPGTNQPTTLAYVDDIILAEGSSNQCQYMLGPSLLVAPITDPLPLDGSANVKTVWLPPGGLWFDFFHPGRVFAGNQTIRYQAPIDTMPLFVKSGTILPMTRSIQAVPADDPSARQHLVLHIYAGPTASFALYEDDGNSSEFQRLDRWTRTRVLCQADSVNNSTNLTIAAVEGTGFAGAPPRRSYEFFFHGFPRPSTILVNGDPLDTAGNGGWTRDMRTGEIALRIAAVPTTTSLTVLLAGGRQHLATELLCTRSCRDSVRAAHKQARAIWAATIGGGDLSKVPRLMRRLDQADRELSAALRADRPVGAEWTSAMLRDIATTLDSDHPLEAVRVIPEPPDNQASCAPPATSLYNANLPLGVATNFMANLHRQCSQLL